jgi:glycosyltransferase involved in cell wall biosynthesis
MEIPKMKVLFVTTAYKRFKGDIITPWLTELIIRLKDQGIDVDVFTSSYRGLCDQTFDRIRIHRFRYFFKKFEDLTHDETVAERLSHNPLSLILVVCYMIMGAWSIVQHVKKEHYDIVHVHWPLPHIVFGVLARAAGKLRLFSTFYGLEIRWFKKRFPWLIKPLKTLINKSDKITAISTHTRQELQHIIQKKIEIIPFSAAVPERKVSIGDDKTILFVGRIVERKGIKYLIKAFTEVKNNIPHNLVIIGEGPERPDLEKLVDQLGLRSRVSFTGWISSDEKLRYYEKCSFFVLPAVYDKQGDIEGLGVVLIEAMSCSKPVIASNAGGITDIVDNEINGILVLPGDVKALAQAIKRLAKNTGLRQKMGKEAKKSIDEKFNWDKIVNRLIYLYNNR